ncbi:hypothetical protein AAAC51_12880 [Priestia megaterium]
MTMLDPLESRFGKKMATVLYFPAILGELFWSAAILTALGTTFGVILGLSFSISIILSALIAIAYTVIGGLWAVAHTDILQLSIMFLGLFLVLPFAFSNTGGWEPFFYLFRRHDWFSSFISSNKRLGRSEMGKYILAMVG